MKKLILIISILLISSTSFGAWQDTLESNFDKVSTFDDLQDWHGTATDYVYDQAQMPKKLDGSASMWHMYSNWDTPKTDWIRNHGAGLAFSGSKSLCINYNCLYDGDPPEETLGYGPSRIGTFFGDGVTGKSGYKKVHIFFMLYIPSTFYPRTADNTAWIWQNGYVKTLEVETGFTAINYYGNATEHAATCESPLSLRSDYGCQFTVFNIQTPGSAAPNTLCYYGQTNYADNAGGCYAYAYYNNTTDFLQLRQTNLTDSVLAGQWFGVEMVLDIGTLNTEDGYHTVNIYSSSGTLLSTESRTGLNNNRLLDHYYNKITIGGNLTRSGTAWSPETRMYYDDFIINGSEIAPTYFSLLAGSPVYEAPTITGPDDFSTTSSSVEIEGAYTVDSGLTVDTITWTLGESGGFAVAALGAFSCTVPVELGENSIVFEITDSESETANDTTIVTRSSVKTSKINGTAVLKGAVIHQ